ncbi:hypothetical protein [Methylocella sp. CPCC 101449]|uniref:hypothetical protein n=1 Tax=Methylocella sp. CPCC 101449 TaxID=2987531 RepID=UPI002891D537|nr:hypothetical protein [Methylocella sp. CPCC 101449]MDT2022809.1 hypothetical protein [Methylocella sp. CPCC 101449]
MQANANAIKLLRRAEAADYLEKTHGQPCNKQYLAKLAVTGGGPAFRKAGKFPLYSPADLDAWALARLSPPVHSTAELPRRGA